MATVLADTFLPQYLARLGSCILNTPDSILDLMFARYSIFPISLVPAASPPTAMTETMCQRLLPVINNPASMFSPGTVPFALCLLLRYRMTPGDDVLNNCDPAHVIMAAVLLANGWLSDWQTNVQQFAIMANVTPDRMRFLKLRLLQVLGYSLWIPDDEFCRHDAKLKELWLHASRDPITNQGFQPQQYGAKYFVGLVWFP